MNTDKEASKSNIPSLASRQPAKTLKRKASDDEIPTAKNTRTKTDPEPALRKPATRPPPRAAKVTALRSVTSAANSTTSTKTATRTAPAKPSASKIISSIPPAEKKSQKRPAWDTKGRLQDMEAQQEATREQLLRSSEAMNNMTEKLESSEAKISELESFRRSLEQNVEVKTRENVDISRKLSDLEHQLETLRINHKEEITTINSRHAREKEELQYSIEALKRAKEDVATSLKRSQEQLSQKENEITQLKNTISTQSGTVLALEAEHRGMKISLETTENTLRACNVRIAELEELLTRETTSVANLEAKVREDETVRRRLHNTILELKGNVRVFCRVRPPLPQEIADSGDASAPLSHITFPESDGKEIELKQSTESVSGQRSTLKSFPFSFDKIFPPQTTQSEIFVEIQQLVQSALDGYNVCIFAYGQTGSGKTYTMEGPSKVDEESQGMISRAVHQIYGTANALTEKGWKYVMEGQFLEIYNEQINDLLGNGDFNRKHDIKHTDGKTTVTDATTVIVDSSEKVNALLKKAGTNRAVGATQCNERSSRSHSVFTLRLQGTNEITDEVSSGCLNLIDLAGSERLSSSGSKGDRLKETQAINKSLSSLGDVICSIANGERHVPYRNSKLTYLLQNSLGGNSKTLMFVNVSPLPIHFSETICSLRFATKVNSCEIGTAKKIKPKQRGED